jgi:purine-nucleoside phosphorylase
MELYDVVVRAAEFIRSQVKVKPEAGIILGTGLGRLTDKIVDASRIPYDLIPGFRGSTVQGHTGHLVVGKLAGKSVVVMEGRLHYYEGFSLAEVTLPVRVMRHLGAELLIINSAAGGLNPLFRPSEIMIVTDHINFQGDNPLRGVSDERLGQRFPDLSQAYDRDLIKLAGKSAVEGKIPIHYGIYAGVSGPSLETPAETRMLRQWGADAVGMSTVPEVIVATQEGLRTLVMAVITNVNLPDCMAPISIQEVMDNASKAEENLFFIMQEVLRNTWGRVSTSGENR